MAAPTGVAAFNIEGHILHSLLSLPVKCDYKDLEGEHLHHMLRSLANMEYLIIDELSVMGRKILGEVDKRLHCKNKRVTSTNRVTTVAASVLNNVRRSRSITLLTTVHDSA